jgi:FkbM family methyltransferase
MIKRPLTKGWATCAESLRRGKVRITAYGCLQIAAKVKGGSPSTTYTVGLNVYGADVPVFGGLGRRGFHAGSTKIDGVSKSLVNNYALGTTMTTDRGNASFQALLPAAPGVYDVQLWIATGSDEIGRRSLPCYKSGYTFGDSDTVTINPQLHHLYVAKPVPLPRRGRRVFLDVGANTGQTLAAVLDPVYGFDRIVCFEPASNCWPCLSRFDDPRVTIERVGLSNKTCEQLLFNPGHQGASMFEDMHPGEIREQCKFVRATEWFRTNLTDRDTVFLKLNCEGAECNIVDDLMESGEFSKVGFMMIDFDVRKIPSQRHREMEVRHRLERYVFPRVAFRKQVMVGLTQIERIQNWLHTIGAGTSDLQRRRDFRWSADDVSW